MSDNGVLNVPICINGGDGKPSALDERELFLDTTNRYLYAGFKGGPEVIKVKEADKASLVSATDVSIGGKDTTVFNVGNMIYEFGTNRLTRKDTDSQYTIHSANLDALQKLVLAKNDVVYGTSLPTSGVEGQVFFKIG